MGLPPVDRKGGRAAALGKGTVQTHKGYLVVKGETLAGAEKRRREEDNVLSLGGGPNMGLLKLGGARAI